MTRANSSDLPHNLVGFLCDPVSEQIVADVIKNMGMAYSESRRGSIADIIEFLKTNRTPKILIADISDSELPLGDIAKIREHGAPNLSIVVVGSRNDVGLFRNLMAMGVSDYLIKPINSSLLRHAIEISSGVVNEYVEKTGKMIQFISSVGGAGATMAATNIGWILANRHFKRSVVMDLDFLYGTANLMLDVKVENAYLDILESPDKIDDYFLETILRKHGQRLYYLGGLVDLVRGTNVDIPTFEALMDIVKRQFNYLLADTQRSIGGINDVCMQKADSFVIMVEMSVASAQNTARLIEYLHASQHGKKILIVANKIGWSSGGALAKESFERVIDRKIDYIMPVDENIALAAANIGQPLAASNGPLTELLEDITDDILGKKENQKIAKAIAEQEGWTIDRIKNLAFDVINKVMTSLK
ncbi:MAG: AAA family ATPase [Holosporaceae bacterium]|jgi:pilus assembly protein CpaE|nr:AAA family ATPase [Holosporaceae bacterium]